MRIKGFLNYFNNVTSSFGISQKDVVKPLGNSDIHIVISTLQNGTQMHSYKSNEVANASHK